MPPKKATAAQKGKAVPETGETSRAQRVTRARAQTMPDVVPQTEGSTVPLSEGPGAAPPLAPEAPAPQPGTEDRTLREAVQLLTTIVAGQVLYPAFCAIEIGDNRGRTTIKATFSSWQAYE